LTLHSSEPYVTPDGERVIASLGLTRMRPPGYLDARWTTWVLDVETGAGEGSAPVGFVVGARGEQLVGSREGSIGPFVTGRMLEQATLDAERPGRSLMVSVQSGGFPTPPQVTLGPDMLFHAGYGILATAPGDGSQGEAVRAFTRDGPLEWCGPVTFSDPVGGSYDLECPQWVTPTDGQPTAPVRSPDGSVLYVRTTAGTLYALDAATGAVRWTATGLGQAGAPALADGTLYVPTGDGQVLAFDGRGCGAPTCPPRQSYATGTTAAVAAPTVAGDVLYATAGGSVHGFAAEGCASTPCPPLWSAPGSGAPVVSGGRVYVRSAAGTDLVAYGLP